MKKVIWIFNHYAITPNLSGGTRHFSLGEKLAQNGFKVFIFASNFLHMTFEFVALSREKQFRLESFDNLSFIWIKTISSSKNNLRRIFNMLSYCFNAYRVSTGLVKKNIIEQPDVIVGSTVHPFAALMSSCLSKKFRVPFIFEIRDLWPQTFIDMGIWRQSSFLSLFFKFIEKQTVLRANKIIVLSPMTVKYLEEQYRISHNKICYIPNGVNSNDYLGTISVSTNRNFKIIYLGGIDSVHGLDVLFESMRILECYNDIELFLYGDGKMKFYYMHKYKLSNINWMSPIEKRKVPEILESADAVFLSTSKVYYGSENKLYEYLAAGKPIISAARGIHNDLVRQLNAGISVTSEDPDKIAEAILTLSNMTEEERKLMGNRGREYVQDNNEWLLLAKKFANVIENT